MGARDGDRHCDCLARCCHWGSMRLLLLLLWVLMMLMRGHHSGRSGVLPGVSGGGRGPRSLAWARLRRVGSGPGSAKAAGRRRAQRRALAAGAGHLWPDSSAAARTCFRLTIRIHLTKLDYQAPSSPPVAEAQTCLFHAMADDGMLDDIIAQRVIQHAGRGLGEHSFDGAA